jgi:hypothetical protein
MQAVLTAASRHEHLVLYDPAAIPADTPADPDLDAQDPKLMPKQGIQRLAARGNALILHIATEDCEARFQVFVEEEPGERLRERGKVLLSGALLEVPTGVLRADGLEFLTRPGERRAASEAEEAAIPPGRYAVEVLDVLSWKLRWRNSEARRRLGRLDVAVHRMLMVYTWLGILFIPANIFVAPMIVVWFWKTGGVRGALLAAAMILAIDLVVFGGFRVLQAAQTRMPMLTRVAQAESEFDRENPDIVVIMRSGAPPTDAPPAFARLRLRT